ncbi:MAG: RNA-guided endonuclease TnpB family protein [Desulfurococcus sp.]|uniref:RNA-guided endonuclease TnpB family protein n=1 Tax=Desulfurococcus sp. TaxID=51678 RepID=UPI0031682E4E
MPEGAYHKSLKTEAEVVDGDINDLLWDLAVHRHALQKVVDALWDLDKLPRRSQLHQMFYQMLREYGFRAHVARNIYSYALALVKAAKNSNGDKPSVRKLSARLDYQDARVELDKGVVKVVLRNKHYILRLKHRRGYIDRFRNLKWKEVHVKYENKKIYVSIVFEVRYKPYTPRGLTAVDVNLRIVTTFDGSEARRYRTRFVEALSKRARAEEIQKRYPKRWRYNERILNRVRALHRRARNIINDYCWKLAKEIVVKAYRQRHAIALEDLEYLRNSINGKSNGVKWKLTLFAYRRLQHAVMLKAIEYSIPILIIDPRNTSSTCPRCGSRLVYVHRLAICRKCGFKRDRDFVGAINIYLRGMWGSIGSSPNGDGMKNETRQTTPNRDEPMTTYIKSYTSI